MTATNPCENCKVQHVAKNPISPDDRAASIHTCRFIFYSLSLLFSFFLLLSFYISLASDNRTDAIRTESHRHAGNTDVPLCNRSLIVSWLIASHHDGICIIQGVLSMQSIRIKLCDNGLRRNACQTVYLQSSSFNNRPVWLTTFCIFLNLFLRDYNSW